MYGQRLSLLCGVVLVLAAAAEAVAVPILLDFEKDTSSVTAPGYTRILQGYRFDTSPPTAVTLPGGELAGWKDYCSAGGVNRTSAPYLPGAGPLMMDFLGFSPGVVETFQVKNLTAGPYDLTLYAADPAYKDKVTQFDIDQNNDGVNDVQVTIDWKNLGETSKTVSLNVSSAGVLSITIQKTGNGAQGCVNGLDLVYVPEPLTLGMLMIGCGIGRRRWR